MTITVQSKVIFMVSMLYFTQLYNVSPGGLCTVAPVMTSKAGCKYFFFAFLFPP